MKTTTFLASLALLAFPACQGSPLKTPDSWSHFRGGPTHSGAAESAQPLHNPTLAWSFDTGGTIESSPTVAEGLVFCGTFDNHLFALDAATGAERWRFAVDGLVRASPSVVDGRVYFGADDERFYCLEAQTGQQLWALDLGPGGQQSSPALADGRVFFGSFDHSVYAVDALNGELCWT
ncbi:MAG: outer membrane protein assembly factor BamB, partial [Pseudohongiellaceae bacterium]